MHLPAAGKGRWKMREGMGVSWRWELERSVISFSNLLCYSLYCAFIMEKLSPSGLRPQTLRDQSAAGKFSGGLPFNHLQDLKVNILLGGF